MFFLRGFVFVCPVPAVFGSEVARKPPADDESWSGTARRLANSHLFFSLRDIRFHNATVIINE